MIPSRATERGSTFIVVLWVSLGLVSLALYFANSMMFELRASDNRVSGLAADQAIEGAIQYVSYALTAYETNGVMPDPATYLNEAVPVGRSHFWLIGRETNASAASVTFGLVDEASKINLNTATSNMLVYLPRMSLDLVQAILDWRDTNGGSGAFDTWYGMRKPAYQNKSAPFESIEELRLLYAADDYTLVGEDRNLNGVLDPDESRGQPVVSFEEALLEDVTVFSREPNTYSNGTPRINIRNLTADGPLAQLLESALGQGRAQAVLERLQLTGASGPRPPGGGGGATVSFTSPLHLYRISGMTPEEFALIGRALTTVNGDTIEGRVNVNTAPATVLACLPGLVDAPDLAQTLTQYRLANPGLLGSVAWVAEALGSANSTAIEALQATDCITTESYQFTADIAALGPNGRGYRRVRVVLDTATGQPRVVYRQDLTHLGWALGGEIRKTWLAANPLP